MILDTEGKPVGDNVEAALKLAARTKQLEKYGTIALGVITQVALGAAGCVLMLKWRDRKSNQMNDNAAQ
jgi:hypothetical protein